MKPTIRQNNSGDEYERDYSGGGLTVSGNYAVLGDDEEDQASMNGASKKGVHRGRKS